MGGARDPGRSTSARTTSAGERRTPEGPHAVRAERGEQIEGSTETAGLGLSGRRRRARGLGDLRDGSPRVLPGAVPPVLSLPPLVEPRPGRQLRPDLPAGEAGEAGVLGDPLEDIERDCEWPGQEAGAQRRGHRGFDRPRRRADRGQGHQGSAGLLGRRRGRARAGRARAAAAELGAGAAGSGGGRPSARARRLAPVRAEVARALDAGDREGRVDRLVLLALLTRSRRVVISRRRARARGPLRPPPSPASPRPPPGSGPGAAPASRRRAPGSRLLS